MSAVPDLVIRDATAADVPALVRVAKAAAIHRDRVRDADGETFRCVIAVQASEVVAFGGLVLSHPPGWPETSYLPQMLDLYVREDRRGRGIGTALIRAMEQMADDAGRNTMHLGVDPDANPRAHALYLRLGYQPLFTEPIVEHWEFTDSEGTHYTGTESLIYLRRELA